MTQPELNQQAAIQTLKTEQATTVVRQMVKLDQYKMTHSRDTYTRCPM